MIWLAFLMNFGVAVGFALLAAISAKRIGGFGPWLLAAVGAIDAFLLIAYRILFSDASLTLGLRHGAIVIVEGFDILLTMLSVVLVLVGFGMMMPKTIRRG